MNYIDLSHEIFHGMPTYPSDPDVCFEQVKNKIIEGLSKHHFEEGKDYVVVKVPNIIDISYGRGVGYTFTEHDLGEEIHKISATRIRKEMRTKKEL